MITQNDKKYGGISNRCGSCITLKDEHRNPKNFKTQVIIQTWILSSNRMKQMFARICTLIYNLVSTSDFLIKEFATSQIHWCSHNSMPREIAILNFKYIEYLTLFCFFVVNFVFCGSLQKSFQRKMIDATRHSMRPQTNTVIKKGTQQFSLRERSV